MLSVEGSCTVLGSDATSIKTIQDVNKTDTHLILTHDGGSPWCGTYHNKSTSINFEIECDANKTSQPTSFTISDATDYCNPTITFAHSTGCPDATLDTVAIFIDKYPWVLAIFLLVVGPVICFFGKRFVPWVIAVIGGIVGAVIVLSLCSAMGMLDYIDPTKTADDASVFWVVLAFFLSLAAGILIGWLLKKFIVIGLLAVAFVGGFAAGGLLYNLVFVGWANSTVLLAILTFGLGAGALVAAFFFRILIIIVVTSLIGSYFTIRGISLFAGGFPSEITLY